MRWGETLCLWSYHSLSGTSWGKEHDGTRLVPSGFCPCPPLWLPSSFQRIGNPAEGFVLWETKGLSRCLKQRKNLFRNRILLINQAATTMPGPPTRSAKQCLHQGRGREGFLQQLKAAASLFLLLVPQEHLGELLRQVTCPYTKLQVCKLPLNQS